MPLPSAISDVSATVNGVPAPLYYVSPGQVNLQIPPQLVAGPALVVISNNGQSASASITLAEAAPGIFTNAAGAPVPSTAAKAGDIITLYVTGTASQSVSVTVGGLPAEVAYAATPPGLQGVVQVNYQVPPQAAAGAQPVVVTAGGIASPPATLLVQ